MGKTWFVEFIGFIEFVEFVLRNIQVQKFNGSEVNGSVG
jgi:hypothetical protein